MVLGTLIIIGSLASCNGKASLDMPEVPITPLNRVNTHALEGDSLFLSDRPYDISYSEGEFIFSERGQSTLLITDRQWQPLRRIGQKGDGPREFNYLGSVYPRGKEYLVHDKGHSRIVSIDRDGNWVNEWKYEVLSTPVINFAIARDSSFLLMTPEKDEPIVSLPFDGASPKRFERKVDNPWNSHHATRANAGFIFTLESSIVIMPPFDKTIEVLDEQFRKIGSLALTDISVFDKSLTRAGELYSKSNNRAIQFYRDVCQSGNEFYLLIYEDYKDLETGAWKRKANKILHLSVDGPENSTISQKGLYQLREEAYYTQIIVVEQKLYAFENNAFQIHEFDLPQGQ